MLIAVCIKQVPAVSALQFDPLTRTIRREGVRSEISAFDVRALLRAIELRDEHGGEVVAITMGPPQAREALAECLALGADRAEHLCDRAFAGADTLATARALAAALTRESYDLILCGRNSVDAETGQVGPEVAELLDLPQVTMARALTLDPAARILRAERETDEGIDVVRAPLPAVVTAAEDLAPERFTTKAEREAAAAKPITTRTAADLRLELESVGAAGSPTWVLDLEAVEEHRRREMIEGATPAARVAALVERLLAHGLFGEWAVERPAPPPLRVPADVARAGQRDVLVVAETLEGHLRPVVGELLHKATQLAPLLRGRVSALVAGAGAPAHAEALAAFGAARVLVAADDGFLAGSEAYAALLAAVIERERPGLVILPATVFGRDLAPRVAARLGLGLTGECVDLSVDATGRVLQHKPAFGGSVVALIASRVQPEMATVRAGMLAPGIALPGQVAEVVHLADRPIADRVHVLERRTDAEAAAELEEAAIVVGVGKGIGGPEHLPRARALADALGGALCTTRDVADACWLPKQYQVGMTGRAIAPQLYIAVALRGAFEHTVGV
ncbi:MAG TPA: FAD-binding protein, partial [Candidatus Dormibacteraeota bacterium]|nr:FAD-binding protein [Candidatus Dormibacteraeota bacterium]